MWYQTNIKVSWEKLQTSRNRYLFTHFHFPTDFPTQTCFSQHPTCWMWGVDLRVSNKISLRLHQMWKLEKFRDFEHQLLFFFKLKISMLIIILLKGRVSQKLKYSEKFSEKFTKFLTQTLQLFVNEMNIMGEVMGHEWFIHFKWELRLKPKL